MSKEQWIEENLVEGEEHAGLMLRKGGPDYHLVLLPDDCNRPTWEEASQWAKKQGGVLPTRKEQSLLFANLGDCFYPSKYWSADRRPGAARETRSTLPVKNTADQATYVDQIPEAPRPLPFLAKIRLWAESLMLGTLFIKPKKVPSKSGSFTNYAGDDPKVDDINDEQAWHQDFMTGTQTHSSVNAAMGMRARAVRRIYLEATPRHVPNAAVTIHMPHGKQEKKPTSSAQPVANGPKIQFDLPKFADKPPAGKQSPGARASRAYEALVVTEDEKKHQPTQQATTQPAKNEPNAGPNDQDEGAVFHRTSTAENLPAARQETARPSLAERIANAARKAKRERMRVPARAQNLTTDQKSRAPVSAGESFLATMEASIATIAKHEGSEDALVDAQNAAESKRPSSKSRPSRSAKSPTQSTAPSALPVTQPSRRKAIAAFGEMAAVESKPHPDRATSTESAIPAPAAAADQPRPRIAKRRPVRSSKPN